MPKDTFQQIPAGKQERVCIEAAKLFAERGFAGTDMAQLARQAGVAKGSLYNYFESKEELYYHVAMDGLNRSRQAVFSGLDREWPVARQLEYIFRRGLEFAQAHPYYIALYLNVSSSGMEVFADRMSLTVEKHTADFLKDLLRTGIRRGEVRRGIDIPLSAYLINSLYIMFLAALVSRHFSIRMKEYLEMEGELNGPVIEERLGRTMDLIQEILAPAGGHNVLLRDGAGPAGGKEPAIP